jgi:hypothetical protein
VGILTRVVVCASFVCSSLPVVAEDVTIVYKVTYDTSGTPIRHKYISPGRAEAWSGPDYGFISEAGKMTRIDHGKWEYSETTEQEQQASLQLLQRQPIHRSLPIDNSVSFEKASDHRTIAGHDCEHYVVTTRRRWDDARPGAITVNTHDYWLAPDMQLETVQARMFEMGARLLQDVSNETIKEVLSKGLVLAEIWSVNGRTVDSEEAIDIKTEPINPSVFRVPFYYAKVESVAATIIRENVGVEFTAVGDCSRTLFTAVGADNDENIAWDATKRAWRSCVTERLGEKWAFASVAKKQCHLHQKTSTSMMVVPQGTEVVPCDKIGGDPKGKWLCHFEAVPCTAPTTP